ncbi:MAG: AAA family ATPase [Dysosmobacter sp.]
MNTLHVLIIDTLQMIRGTNYDNTYANDYRDLSALKRIADAHGIAILLIHHLRKETADDAFNRIPYHCYQRCGGFQLHTGGE